MLIHITPRMYIPHRVASCELASLNIKEFGLKLTEKDLMARKPYPNKRFWVACRRKGQRAISGILLTTDLPVTSFTVEAHWVIDGHQQPFTHVTNYRVLDSAHELVSDNMLLWYSFESRGEEWESRWAPAYKHLSPAQASPKMEIFPRQRGADPAEKHRRDTLGVEGFIEQRSEDFQMLTLEPERLFSPRTFSDRMPSRDSAILVSSITKQQPHMEHV
jgi:hypothetical protein